MSQNSSAYEVTIHSSKQLIYLQGGHSFIKFSSLCISGNALENVYMFQNAFLATDFTQCCLSWRPEIITSARCLSLLSFFQIPELQLPVWRLRSVCYVSRTILKPSNKKGTIETWNRGLQICHQSLQCINQMSSICFPQSSKKQFKSSHSNYF